MFIVGTYIGIYRHTWRRSKKENYLEDLALDLLGLVQADALLLEHLGDALLVLVAEEGELAPLLLLQLLYHGLLLVLRRHLQGLSLERLVLARLYFTRFPELLSYLHFLLLQRGLAFDVKYSLFVLLLEITRVWGRDVHWQISRIRCRGESLAWVKTQRYNVTNGILNSCIPLKLVVCYPWYR